MKLLNINDNSYVRYKEKQILEFQILMKFGIYYQHKHWVEVTDLISHRRTDFWMTASTRVGESKKSPVASATPSNISKYDMCPICDYVQ